MNDDSRDVSEAPEGKVEHFEAMELGRTMQKCVQLEQAILNLRKVLPADDFTAVSKAIQEATAKGVDADTIAEVIRDQPVHPERGGEGDSKCAHGNRADAADVKSAFASHIGRLSLCLHCLGDLGCLDPGAAQEYRELLSKVRDSLSTREEQRAMSRTRWGRGRKHETPRGAKPCQFGVKDKQGHMGVPVVVDCGRPAVAEWTWSEHGEPLRACEQHDAKARADTPPEMPGVSRRPVPRGEDGERGEGT